jgi:hypothetical protein
LTHPWGATWENERVYLSGGINHRQFEIMIKRRS